MKIAIDPGHGMGNSAAGVFDPGAVRRVGAETFAEADIVLRYGLTLKRLCDENGVESFMTRTSSADPAPVGRRATRARNEGCTHFVSLHLNSSTSAQANGVEVLFRDTTKDGPLAQRLLRNVVDVTGLRERETQQRTNVAVLKFSAGPAALIELGFISNDGDRSFLLDGDNREAVCRGILDVLANGG